MKTVQVVFRDKEKNSYSDYEIIEVEDNYTTDMYIDDIMSDADEDYEKYFRETTEVIFEEIDENGEIKYAENRHYQFN